MTRYITLLTHGFDKQIMMKINNQSIIFAVMVILNSALLARASGIQWTKIFGGGGYSVQQTSEGDYIIAGTREANVLLIKTDANGIKMWTLNPLISRIGHFVLQTTDGGYIIVGKKDRDVLLIKVAPDVTSIEGNPNGSLIDYYLIQNYPNPFNPKTTIDFSSPQSGFVTLKIYNI